VGVEHQRGVTGDLGHGRRVRTRDRHTAPHRLEHRQPEALAKGGEGEAARRRVKALQVRGANPPGQHKRVSGAEALRTGGELRAERRRIGGHDDLHLGNHAPDLRKRLDERPDVLVGKQCRDGEHDRT
jgi:hypothetical protein